MYFLPQVERCCVVWASPERRVIYEKVAKNIRID